ncbi:MAG TPA: ChbG/HpnK family deacetylase [Acidobacteriaceae bacterium]|nr:ChbG/HpnK family deacetylase [Acidobacteriaceae bacterium]
MRRLIVNADDFALTDGINRAVVDLHTAGALTSATLMAAAPRFSEAVALARQDASLGVGCHVVLVDGSPVSAPAAIPSLMDDGPRFRTALGGFIRDLYLGRIHRADMEREATAQIQKLQRAGIRVTHIDTHKHTHMFPAVLDAVTRAANHCGVPAIRNPFEPSWSVAATPDAGTTRRIQVELLRRFLSNFRRVVEQRQLATTDGCVGVLATGSLDQTALNSLLRSLPEGTWELVCHPAYLDSELLATRTRLQNSREIERSALLALPEGLAMENIQTCHFGQLT